MSGPDKWGPHGWKFIHYITLGYPDRPTSDHKNRYKKFFLTLTGVIPCVLCRNNYIKHLKEYPISDKVLKNKKNLMGWGVLMHNLVNKSNNKKVVPIDKGIQMIYQSDDTCVKENFGLIESEKTTNLKKIVCISPVILFGIILIYQLIKVYCKNKK